MKKLFTITLLLIAMTLSAERVSNKDSEKTETPESSKVEKTISKTAEEKESYYNEPKEGSTKDSEKTETPESSKVGKTISKTAEEKESYYNEPQESSTLDLGIYMGIMGCVGLIVALSVLVMSFLSKKRLERRFARLDEKISELKTDFSEQVAEIKDFAEKQTSDVREEVLSEIQSQREMPMDTPPVKKEKIEQLESQNRFEKKVYYALYQSGEQYFDEADFKGAPNSSLPFKITLTSPTEAEVEVTPGYDPSLNSQVKAVCKELSGNWATFTAVTVVKPGIIKKSSASASYWILREKIEVNLS